MVLVVCLSPLHSYLWPEATTAHCGLLPDCYKITLMVLKISLVTVTLIIRALWHLLYVKIMYEVAYHIVIVDILSMQGLIIESSLRHRGINVAIRSGVLRNASLWFSMEKY